MAPAGDAGAPFRLVARADLDELVGAFQPRGERAPGRPPRHPVTATALLFDPGGETLHVACAGAEVCVAHCRVAQGTTPSGDVRSRFVVDDVTPSPRPPASPRTSAAPSRPEPTSRVQVVDRTIRELCAVRSRRAVAARADAGVEVHYYDDRSSSGSLTAASSATTDDVARRTRVFVIPDTANAVAIASDARAHRAASRVAVASPGGRKRVVVYEVPPYWDTGQKKGKVVFDIAADIVLGLAHPARAMAWLGATLVIGTPRGAVAVRVADGMAEPLVLNFSSRAPLRGRDERRARNAALAALAPRRPSPDGASYDTMFGSERSGLKEDTKETEEEVAAAPALAVSFSFEAFSTHSDAEPTPSGVVARAPDGTLLRVWLPGADGPGRDDEEDEEEDAFSNASGARVLILDDAAKSFFARSERLDVTCAPPFAVAAPVNGGAARAVDLTGLAPGDSHALALGVSGDGAAKDIERANESRLLIAGAPGGAALGRGDDENDDERFFSCPASASSLLAARGGVLELHRARSTRERVVELAVAGRLEEAVALADARGADVDANDEPVSQKNPTKKAPFAVAARAECGFLAASLRLDFALAVSLWRSAGSALSLSELLPYFPRQGGSKTSFRGRVEASAVGAGAENDATRFVSRLGAREILSGGKRDVQTPFVADLETVVSSHASRPGPSEIEQICRDAKAHFASLFASRPALDGDPRKRIMDTLTLRLWAETGDAGALERALAGAESNEKTNAAFFPESHTTEHTTFVGERDVDVSVLGPALTASGRHFARALSYWRLEKDDDTAFETYAALARGELVEAPCEPVGGAAASFGSSTLAAARLASALFRERCREDLRGAARRPDDEAVARWTRRHLVWILRFSPGDGVAVLATPRVARLTAFPFVLESLVSANASRATRVKVLRDRIRPFAPDRANGDAHTAFAVALWQAAEEDAESKDAEGKDESISSSRDDEGRKTNTETTLVSSEDSDEVFDESLVSFLRREPRRVDARAALAALDPNAVTSSSVRGMLALGLVTGVRVAPPAIPKALARHAAALAELRAAVGDHVAAYRLLAEVARDADAAEAHVARFGEEARRARDRVLEIANRPPRAEDPKPGFSLRGKV